VPWGKASWEGRQGATARSVPLYPARVPFPPPPACFPRAHLLGFGRGQRSGRLVVQSRLGAHHLQIGQVGFGEVLQRLTRHGGGGVRVAGPGGTSGKVEESVEDGRVKRVRVAASGRGGGEGGNITQAPRVPSRRVAPAQKAQPKGSRKRRGGWGGGSAVCCAASDASTRHRIWKLGRVAAGGRGGGKAHESTGACPPQVSDAGEPRPPSVSE
jgi:hypothetical protein